MNKSNSLILALPKGRVYEDFVPLLEKTQFAIKDDVKKSRKMLLDTKHPSVKVLIISIIKLFYMKISKFFIADIAQR